jgi:hypothetical protein
MARGNKVQEKIGAIMGVEAKHNNNVKIAITIAILKFNLEEMDQEGRENHW